MDLSDRYVSPGDDQREDAVELRAFTHGLMPKTVPAMMKRFCRDWQTRGVDAWNEVGDWSEVGDHWQRDNDASVGWWTLPEHLGDRFVAPMYHAVEGVKIFLDVGLDAVREDSLEKTAYCITLPTARGRARRRRASRARRSAAGRRRPPLRGRRRRSRT